MSRYAIIRRADGLCQVQDLRSGVRTIPLASERCEAILAALGGHPEAECPECGGSGCRSLVCDEPELRRGRPS